MNDMVYISLQIIQTNFTRESSDNPAGTAKLTVTSSTIGGVIHKYIKREPVPWNMEVRIGDLFVEAFYNCGYIDIYYPKVRNTSYILSATPKWVELADLPEAAVRINLVGTVTERPTNINRMKQAGYDRPVIKDNNDRLNPEDPWVRSINKLQQTGWRINTGVYEALIDNKDNFISSSPIENNEAKEMKRRSKKLEWDFITKKAKVLKDEDVFYQYIEADYRGRLYYGEPFLNYQGSDISRGMLQFARKKPMTESGLWWLAVHTACCFNQSYGIDEIPEWCEADYCSYLEDEKLESISVDKFTLEDRVRWTNHNMKTLIEAGRSSHIFFDAEKPVSLLAACIEWHKYSEAEADNRIYFTHLPIPIDGSNNGWQHLGAMSKDTQTASLVGLIPQEIQSDFYVQTAKELYRRTKDEERKKILDSMPMKHIRKGISKRGSMTRAYSAGATKIAENMWFDCRTEDYHEEYSIDSEHCLGFARDLVKAIDAVCPGPLKTMGYLQQLASYEIGRYAKYKDGVEASKEFQKLRLLTKKLYSKRDKTEEELKELNDLIKEMQTFDSIKIYGAGSDYLTWTTPSGFPVKYEDYAMKSVKTYGTIGGFKKIKHVARIPTKQPDIRSFMCGVSPNFVHSMDASHMALVIDQWNGDFGAVHDSFSTHACDVEDLVALTKQTFVEMYDVDNFYDYIRKEITNNEDDVKQPTLGSLDIQEVYDSDYFFA